MCSDPGQSADWRNAAAYAPLLDSDRSIFAWEWLRRNPAYRAAAVEAFAFPHIVRPSCARSWGLHRFENPDLPAAEARPIWLAEMLAHVLPVLAVGPGAAADAFELASFGPLATIVTGDAGWEHLLLSDGLRAIRLDILAGSVAAGPVQLHYSLAGLVSAEKPLLTLRRLLALWRTGRFSRSLHVREPRARRWVLMLRAHDALAAGADQREIAEALLSPAAGEPRWRTCAPSVRSQVQRLVRAARQMSAGGYRALLR